MNSIKHLVVGLFVLGALLLSNACQDSSTLDPTVSQAKAFFEQHAQTLSLPLFGKVDGTICEMASSVYPVWEDAIISSDGESTIIEVPITGPCRVVASIVTVHDNHKHVEKATTQSYLVLRTGGTIQPSMFVETFIQQGRECTMTAKSNRESILGFEIQSDIEGTIRANQGVNNGRGFIADSDVSLSKIEQLKYDFVGYRVGYATITKGHIGCPDYAWVYCPFCESSSYINTADLDPRCPNCGAVYMNGYFYCSTCGLPFEQCYCADGGGSCAVCGRNKLNCNGCSNTSYYCECD